jgi:hypothetical protein
VLNDLGADPAASEDTLKWTWGGFNFA